ncbi:LacI family DNA-binding transcriptional regulator [Rhizosphaericola mali]|uniref:LacI family transcriptional regulator n=1 Tax=Rhizosphaericola mali TaxID=2545455 RepID=A0A5P2FX02_9BACT|nr:LacI family DNA-binding transcriptional regulator [Rhizosphaericola mali]QES87715.1 LacI family transcriptional regulator [Rhizosphaericola mali]
MEKTTTIKEIAVKLNVSTSTVSRALNNHPSIGEITRNRIKATAKEMNYAPNLAAIQFKKGKSFTIGVIIPELSETFFSDAISGIEDVTFKQGYNVIFGQSHNDIDKEKAILESFKRNRVDGILVSLSKTTKNLDHFHDLSKMNIPVVFFDRVPKTADFHYVKSDLYKVSVEIINFLWEKNHRNIALLKGPNCMASTNERMKGVLDGFIKKRVKTDGSLFGITDLTKEGTFIAMKDILSQKNRPTAIIAFNDFVALDAMEYIQAFTSLKINKDIVIVSYANNPLLKYLKVFKPAASVEQFPYLQGEKATSILLDLINNGQKLDEKGNIILNQIIIDAELVDTSKSYASPAVAV